MHRNSFRSKGFLSSHTVKEIKHPATDLLEYHLSRKIKSLTLQITQNCNLRCKYCIFSGNYENRTHKAVNMTYEMAKNGIDFLLNHSVDSNAIDLGFYDGEPILVFALLKECILYAEHEFEGKKVTFNITTNGTLITEEIICFFEEHNVHLMISLDGPKDIHNSNRGFANSDKGSFDLLMDNIKWITEKHPRYYKEQMLFHTVIDPRNSLSCVNEFFANSKLFEESILSAALISDINIKEQYELPESYIEEYNYEIFKIYLYKLGRLNEKYVSKLLLSSFEVMKQNSSDFVLTDTAHHGGPCIAGAHRLFLNVDGYFYPCERVSEESDIMKIGNINEGINIEKAKRIMNVGKISESRCKKCWAFMYCGICASQADNLQDLSDDLVKIRCTSEKSKTENMFKDYCTLRELGYDFGSQRDDKNYFEIG